MGLLGMAARMLLPSAAALGLAGCSASTRAPCGTPAPCDPTALTVHAVEFLGTTSLPSGTAFAGTTFGGISGLCHDPVKGCYYALCDDRSERAPARFYTLTIDLGDRRLGSGDLVITGVTTLRDEAGTPFSPGSLDPEGIALAPSGTTVWISSEGDAQAGIAPFVREFRLEDGRQVGALPVAGRYLPAEGRGIRHNLAFESLTLTPDGRFLVTAVENALLQDGPAATLTETSATLLHHRLTAAMTRTAAEWLSPYVGRYIEGGSGWR